ncbi:MAG: T9SS type B sorting domain-containing protein [Paludibacteraceae bacterium]|nr:T9SS type B sorting domain-containing protein [Paludibacteraceae bacterium]
MKKIFLSLVLGSLCTSGLIFAQNIDCKDRLIRNLSFKNTEDASAERWSMSDIDDEGFAIADDYTYTENGSTNNTATKAYAIVKNPSTIDNAYADITPSDPEGGILVMDPLRNNNNDQFGIFTVGGLVPGKTYYVEIKVWNLFKVANSRECCWNDLLRVEAVGNGNNAHDGNSNWENWRNSVYGNTGSWDMGGNYPQSMLRPAENGSYVIMKGKKTLGNQTTGFTLTFQKGGSNEANQMVLGLEYIKIYGCEEESIRPKNGGTTVCEGDPNQLIAYGIGPAGSSFTWTKTGGTITNPSNTNKLSIVGPAAGESETYTCRGEWNTLSITVKGAVCCSNVGEKFYVFEERFNQATTNCGNKYGKLADGEIGTEYKYAGDVCGTEAGITCVKDGQYAVVKQVKDAGYWGGNGAFGWNTYNHTTHTADGSGLLLVNAAGSTDYVYKKQLTGLCANTAYSMEVWYGNPSNSDGNKPNLTLEVRDNANRIIESMKTGEIPNNNKLQDWHKAELIFQTTNENSFTLYVYDNNTSTGSGNDFIIDDILVSRCLIKVNLVDEENELESDACSKDDKTLTIDKAQLTKYFAEAWFQWQKSNTGTSGWTNIGTPTQNNTLTVTPTASNVWYRAKIGGSAQDVASDNISPTSCTNDTYSSAFRLKLADEIDIQLTADNTSVCPGDALKLTGTTTATNPTYAWAFSENGDFATATTLSGKKNSYNIANVTTENNGTYYLIVTTNDGECEAHKGIDITVNPAPTLVVTGEKEQTLCEGANINNITLEWTNATIEQTGTLPTGVTFNQATGVISGTPSKAGTYEVTFTAKDQSVCNKSLTENIKIIVNEKATLTISDKNTQKLCLGESMTDITYSWTNANITITELPDGVSANENSGSAYASGSGIISGTPTESKTIKLTATDNNSCATIEELIGIQTNPVPVITLADGQKSKVLIGTSTQLTVNVPGGTWSSSDNNAATVDASGKVTAANSIGDEASKDITITYTTSAGCKATFELKIVSYGPMGDDETYNYCKGEEKDITLNGHGENITRYEWYLDDLNGTPFKTGDGMTDTYTASTNGMEGNHTYYFRGCNGTGSTNCAEQKFEIIQTPDYAVSISVSKDYACLNEQVTVNATQTAGAQNETYTWHATGVTGTANGNIYTLDTRTAANGEVYVTATADGYCQTDSEPINVSISGVTLGIGADVDYICDDADTQGEASISLTITPENMPADAVQQIKWYRNGTEITDNQGQTTLTATQSGNYSATVSYTLQGKTICEETKNINIRSEKLQMGDNKSYEICAGNEISLEGQADGAKEDGTATFEWITPDGTATTSANKKIALGKMEEDGTFVYTFRVTKLTCTASQKHTIKVKPFVEFEVEDVETVCKGDRHSVRINEIRPQSGATYTWNDGTQQSTGLSYTLPSANAQSGKQITVKANANDYCESEQTFRYDISALTIAADWPDYYCPDEEVDLEVRATESGTSTTLEYTWSENGTPTSDASSIATFTPQGDTQFAVEVSNEYCTERFSKTIRMADINISFEEDVTATCPGNEVQITAQVSDNTATVTWTREDTEDMSVVEIGRGVSIKDTPAHTSIYTATLSNKNCTNSAEIVVELHPAPVIDTILPIEPAPKTVQILVSNGTAPYSFAVDNKDYTSGDIFGGLRIGRHTAYVADENGCDVSLVFTIEPLPLEFPMYFTPNGDGLNDTWIVKNLDIYEKVDLYIYDRYGKELKHITDPIDTWDGTYLGKKLPSTDYWYYLHIDEIGKTYYGHFTLVN